MLFKPSVKIRGITDITVELLNKFDITQGNNKYTINNNIFDFYAPMFVPVNHYIHKNLLVYRTNFPNSCSVCV